VASGHARDMHGSRTEQLAGRPAFSGSLLPAAAAGLGAPAALPPLRRRRGVVPRVNLTDRSGQTGTVRYRYTGLVWPETGRYRWNSNFAVQPVRTGIPVGLTGNRPNSIFFLFFLNSNARKVY